MKYIVAFILLASVMQAQTFNRAHTFNEGVVWNDSLISVATDSAKILLPDATDSTYSDTSKIYEFNGVYEWIGLIVKDSGSIDDTLNLYLGTIIRNQGGAALDTNWVLARVRDSSWTVVDQPLTGTNEGKEYTVDDVLLPATELMKIDLDNTEWVPGRRTILHWKARRIQQ